MVAKCLEEIEDLFAAEDFLQRQFAVSCQFVKSVSFRPSGVLACQVGQGE